MTSPKAPSCHCPMETGLSLSNAVVEESPSELWLQHLSASDAESISKLVSQFPEVFTSKLGLTHLLEYDISLKDTQPVRLPPHYLSPPKVTYLRGLTVDMLESGIIRPSCSPYSSPMFLVPLPSILSAFN